MRRTTREIGGILLASVLAGCGEAPPADEAVRIQPSNSEQFNAVKQQLSKGALSELNSKKPGDLKPGTPRPADAKPADTTPATAPAATTKPAEAKPAPPAPPTAAKSLDPKTPEKKP